MKKLKKGMIFLSLILSNLFYIYGQWVRIFGEPGSEYPAIVLTATDNSIILAGSTTADSYNGYSWIMKLSSYGERLWTHSYRVEWNAPNSLDEIHSVYYENDQFLVFAGNTTAYQQYQYSGTKHLLVYKTSVEGDILWTKVLGGYLASSAIDVHGAPDGGYIVAGYSSAFGAGSIDVIIIKLDKNGELEWQKAYGGLSNEQACCVYSTNDGGYIFAGSTFSFEPFSKDFWVVKLNALGEMEWERAYGRTGDETAYSFALLPGGGYIIAGESSSEEPGKSDAWILRLTDSGNIQWQKAYTQGEKFRANSIIVLAEGGYAAAGTCREQGRDQLVFFKLSEDGDVVWQKKFSSSLVAGDKWEETSSSLAQTVDGGFVILGVNEEPQSSERNVLVLLSMQNGDLGNCEYVSSCDLIKTDSNIVPNQTNATITEFDFIDYNVYVTPASTNFSMITLCPYKKNIIRR